MKKTLIVLGIIILAGIGAYAIFQSPGSSDAPNNGTAGVVPPPSPEPAPAPAVETDGSVTVIGKSVQGRDITAHHYGSGSKKILFVGGIHGGYEWNTTLVAYELMDYLKATPSAIPASVQVTVIPVLNPDGLSKVTDPASRFTKADITASQAVQISGRYNANTVDLNRNFDCDWQATGKWQGTDVSGGSAPFSEPESAAMKQYIETRTPAAVVVWNSAAGGVFSSSCTNGILPETAIITDAYAKASGYPAYKSFDFYAVTGDLTNWLAKQNIPAISVLLTDHTNTEWVKNKKGIDALIARYAR